MINVQESLERLPERFNKQQRWVAHAKRLNTRFLLVAGESSFRITVADGKVDRVEPGPFIMGQWDFVIKADEQTWQKFWQPKPAPGFHDVLALSKTKKMSIQGNIYPFMSNLLYFKAMLAAVRHSENQ